ncbi:MAG: symporter small accessory protein [Bacillota bacterium]
MLGLEGFGVFLAYVLCIASTLLCVVYGVARWNSDE